MAEELSPRRSAGGSRVPPHDLHAEESLLGAMMLEPEAIASAAGVLRADDFYKPAHSHIFDAVHALYATGQPVDAVTVADELRRNGLLETVGGVQVLLDIMASTPATTSAGGYARIIEELALLRRLIGVAGEIAEIGYGMPEDVTKALDRAEAMVYDVNQRRVTDTTLQDRRPARSQPRSARAALRPGRRHHRRAHGLRRPRRPAVGPATQQPGHRRRPTRHGEVRGLRHADRRPGDR